MFRRRASDDLKRRTALPPRACTCPDPPGTVAVLLRRTPNVDRPRDRCRACGGLTRYRLSTLSCDVGHLLGSPRPRHPDPEATPTRPAGGG